MATQTGNAEPYVFISYASADHERVLPVVDALRRAGVSVWLDQQGIAGGENYALEITEAIEHSAALALMCSAASLASRNVKQEIALAWKFERPYLPLLLETVAIPKDVMYWLEAAQWVAVLDKAAADWLPAVLAALAPLGIVPAAPQQEHMQLAGREKELALLRDKLAAAKDGKGGLVLIGGEAGIGKTTLAGAALDEAKVQGFILLEGHCFDLAETPPYGLWIDLFARFAPSASSPPLPEAFAQRGTVGAAANQMALFVQVRDFLATLSTQRPVALLLDDLHWADPASLDLLRYLARSLSDLPLLMLVTYRTDEVTRKHPLAALLPQLARDAGTERIDLGRLDGDAVLTLVRARYHLPDSDAGQLVAYVQSRAEGNALFVGELLRSLEESGALLRTEGAWILGDLSQIAVPALLRQVIDGRLGRLDEESQRLLAVAAVIGQEVPLDVWATVGECDEDALLTVVERGLDARLLVEAAGDDRVRFAHALIREALYEQVPGIRQRRVHRRVGDTLAAQARPDPDAVAYHFGRARDVREKEWLIAAGERARGAYAWYTASARFDAALALMPDNDTAERGWLLYRTARLRIGTTSITLSDEARRIGEAIGDKALSAVSRYTYGHMICRLNEPWRGFEHLMAGAEAIEALAPDDRERLNAVPGLLTYERETPRGVVTLWAALTGRFEQVLALADEWLLPLTSAPGADRTSPKWGHAWSGVAYTYAALGRPAEASRAATHAFTGLRREGLFTNLVVHAGTLMDFLTLPYTADDIAEREQVEAQGAEDADRIEEANRAIPYAALVGTLRFLEGNWDDPALTHTYIGLTQAFNLIPLLRERGKREDAWRLLRPELERIKDYGEGAHGILARWRHSDSLSRLPWTKMTNQPPVCGWMCTTVG